MSRNNWDSLKSIFKDKKILKSIVSALLIGTVVVATVGCFSNALNGFGAVIGMVALIVYQKIK